ncbi:beta strand repeat-containing protein [Haloferula sp.]|uniref:beta strand repeat-containing protein n=1 Tax=Haloferula sp. TaxID=2497595 RepID=UPI003C777654
MKPKHQKLLLAAISLTISVPVVHAGQIWDGGGVNDNWTSPANWDGNTSPNFNNEINFKGDTRTSPINNLAADTLIGGIRFENNGDAGFDAAFNLLATGNGITLGGGIVTETASTLITDTIGFDIILNANRTITTKTNHNLTITGIISQDASNRNLSKAGAGTLTLSNTANTFAGQVLSDSGTIQVTKLQNNGTASSIGAGNGSIRLGNNATATLEYIGTSDSSTNKIIQIGTNTATNTGNATILNNSASGKLTFTGNNFNATAGGGITVARALTLGGSYTGAANEITGVIQDHNTAGGGIVSLTKEGASSWALSGNNTYTGTTTISGGVLNIQHANALGGTAAGTEVAAGATLQLQGGISYAAEALTLNNNTINSPMLQNVSGDNTWNGNITTTGNVASSYARFQSDAGTLTVAGTIDTAANDDSSAVLQGNSAITVTGKITGDGGLFSSNNGSGIRTISNIGNDYTGATTLSGGTLSVGSTGNLGAAASNLVFNGGTLQITGTTLSDFSTIGHTVSFNAAKTVGLDIDNAAHTFTVDQVLDQTTGGFTKSGLGTVVLNQANTYAGGTTISEGTLQLSGSGSLGSGSYAGGISIASGALLGLSGSGNQILSGVITGAGTLRLETGGVTLSNGANDFGALTIAGGSSRAFINNPGAATTVNVDAGILVLNATGAYDSAVNVENSGGIAVRASGGATLANVTLPGSGTVSFNNDDATTRSLTISSGQALTGNLNVNLGGGRTNVNAVGDVELSGILSGASGALTVDSPGTLAGRLILSGDNTYDGSSTVNGATLMIAGNQTGAGQFVVNNDAVLQFGDGTSTDGSAVNAGTVFVNNTGTVNLFKTDGGTFGNSVASNPSATITLSGTNLSGTTNEFTGTSYSNGGSISTLSTNAGAILEFSNASALDIKGTTLTVGGAGDTLFSGAIYNSTGSGLVTKTGSGTAIYQAVNTYGGVTAIDEGAIRVDTAPTSGGTYFVGNGGTTGTAASLLLGGGTTGLTGGVTFDRAVTSNPGDGTNRTLGGTNTSGTNTYSSTIVLDGLFGENRSVNLTAASGGTVAFTNVISGPGQNLTKTGNGTIVLSGNNTYGGATNVDEGTLVIDGDQSGATGDLTVANGATLGGSGTIGGDVEISGTHMVGNSPGIQTVKGNLRYNAGSIFEWELIGNTVAGRGTDYDGVNGSATKDLTIVSGAIFDIILDGSSNGGSSSVSFANAFWQSDQQWDVFTGFNSVTGNFGLGSVTVDSLGADFTSFGSFSLAGTGGTYSLNWTAVPEPTSALAGLLLAAGLLRRQRRD